MKLYFNETTSTSHMAKVQEFKLICNVVEITVVHQNYHINANFRFIIDISCFCQAILWLASNINPGAS